MKVTAKRTSETHAEIHISMDDKDLAPMVEKAVNQLVKDVKVEGFRKGKAPVKIAATYLDPNKVAETALDITIRSSVVPIFKQADLIPLETPHFDVTKYVPGKLIEFHTSLDVFPEVKLGDYRHLDVEMPVTKITNRDINKVLKGFSQSFADKVVVRRAAQKGDEVIIDFDGIDTRDGLPFKGGNKKDFHLVIGSNQFIKGFEEGIIGHEVGDRFDVHMNFPKTYRVKELAGAPVVFSMLLKQVNEIRPAAIDDSLAVKCGSGFSTLDELKEDIRRAIQRQAVEKDAHEYQNRLVEALVKASKVSAPEVMVQDQMRLMREDFTRNSNAHGLSYKEFVRSGGYTMESWDQKLRAMAEKRILGSLVLQTLAVECKIAVSPKEVAARIADMKAFYKKDKTVVKQLNDSRMRADIANRMLIDKTLDFLVESQENPKVTDQKPAAKATKSTKSTKPATKSTRAKSKSHKTSTQKAEE